MYTIEDIRVQIQPVPQKVTGLPGDALKLSPSSKVCFTAPNAEKGPVKTAAEDMKTYLMSKLGEDCFAADGIAVTLKLSEKPEEVKSENEGYRITVNADGITIEGFGPSGLFYGVVSFQQMTHWNSDGAQIPAVEVLDWPDSSFRGYKEECRYGSNMMEKEDWLAMIDDLAAKKFNRLNIALYGCWVVQYDGKVAEYLYLPLKNHPEINTPQTVKYYSPSENKWYHYETLPPIYRDNFLGELFRYAKDRAIDIVPGINSFGHNTLFPRMLPETAPKDENGNPVGTGFCTSSEETYKFLFSIYDQIIDDYLIPNDIYTFNILLDEVRPEFGVDPERPGAKLSPWCQCDKCKDQDHGDIFINHAVKLISYLKSRGIKTIQMANDMVARKSASLGYLGDRFLDALRKAHVDDVFLSGWWRYIDNEELFFSCFHHKDPNDLPMRTVFAPHNGYFIWNSLLHPMRNIKIHADLNHKTKLGEGFTMYAMWDRSYDRIHDCLADYAWNYHGAGELASVTERYVARHFAPMQEEAIHAFRLMEWITEERKANKDPENPLGTILNNYELIRAELPYYFYCYFKADQPFPRHYPGFQLKQMLNWRWDYERALFSIASMAKEAVAIFRKAAVTPGCDQAMADRLSYECENYQCLAEDWLALLRIYDLTQNGDQKKIAPIARARQNARLALMSHCEQVKEAWSLRSGTMRNLCVMMQNFADIAAYIEATDDPKLDLFDITPIMSKENFMIR